MLLAFAITDIPGFSLHAIHDVRISKWDLLFDEGEMDLSV
jgi:hypothetical protein